MQLVLQMVSGYGGEFRSWKFPDVNKKAYIDMDYYVEKAKIAEKWKFHGIFIADTPALTVDMTHDSPMHPMEPILQERGIFHKDYEGSTLRENMQIPYQYGFNE